MHLIVSIVAINSLGLVGSSQYPAIKFCFHGEGAAFLNVFALSHHLPTSLR